MKSLIICQSFHHQNTQKIAQVIAKTLSAKIKKPSEVVNGDISSSDHIGFGSGIFFNCHHPSLLDFADNLSDMKQKPVFIFSTSGAPFGVLFHQRLKNKLLNKNCRVVGEFNCFGWDSYGLLKTFGGLHKTHPDKNDLANAKFFAKALVNKLKSF